MSATFEYFSSRVQGVSVINVGTLYLHALALHRSNKRSVDGIWLLRRLLSLKCGMRDLGEACR